MKLIYFAVIYVILFTLYSNKFVDQPQNMFITTHVKNSKTYDSTMLIRRKTYLNVNSMFQESNFWSTNQ